MNRIGEIFEYGLHAVRSMDIIVHSSSLKLHVKQDWSHRTIIGGVASLFVFVYVLNVGYNKFIQMVEA